MTAAYLGPAVDAIQREGDIATTWELTWTLPATEEFVAPAETIPDPNLGTGQTPPPAQTMPPPDPDAWVPLDLPNESGGLPTDVAFGDRYVAVGGRWGVEGARGLIWTSSDGIRWEEVTQAFPDLDFTRVVWDGTRFVAIAGRADMGVNVYPESWTSTDGLTWERGGLIGPALDSGEVANTGRLMAVGSGWLLGGSIWSLADNQQRPAFFTSTDGVTWETVELRDVGSGSLGQLAQLADGTLFATGCEEPGDTNSGAQGASCLMRPWYSDDGESWAPGPVFGLELSGIGRWGERLIGLSSTGDAFNDPSARTRVLVSDDGADWTELSVLAGEEAGASGIHVLDNELVLSGGHVFGGMFPIAAAWRSADGVSWVPIPLGLPDGAIGSGVAGVHLAADGRIVLTGHAWMSETDTRPVVWIEP